VEVKEGGAAPIGKEPADREVMLGKEPSENRALSSWAEKGLSRQFSEGTRGGARDAGSLGSKSRKKSEEEIGQPGDV